MIVAFLRHGSTAWNEQGRMQGRRDVPLSARGRDEVRAWRLPSVASAVAPVEPTWVSSPLRRAVETAELLSGATPQCESALIEMDWGEWEGFDLDELRRRHGEVFARNEAAGLDFRPPGGESPREVRDRVMSWLAANATHRETMVVVTHKGVLRAVLAAATGWDMIGKPPLRLQHGALHRFAVGPGGRVMVQECNVPLVATPIEDATAGERSGST
jgi:2,3-bisphosphoglycerate-dependent phosphoglycerate mutase